MEVRRAIADLAEVRDRLARVQRFDGYSGNAAVASGYVAFVFGLAQLRLAPFPATRAEHQTYLTLWLLCLGIALALNYGAILAWRARHRDAQSRVQVRTVGASILPAVAAGGVITLALVLRGELDLLPGMWCATYALGLFASRAMVPREVVTVAVGFGAAAVCLLLVPALNPLAWWTMPLVFGIGQIAIGTIVKLRPNSIEGKPSA